MTRTLEDDREKNLKYIFKAMILGKTVQCLFMFVLQLLRHCCLFNVQLNKILLKQYCNVTRIIAIICI